MCRHLKGRGSESGEASAVGWIDGHRLCMLLEEICLMHRQRQIHVVTTMNVADETRAWEERRPYEEYGR